MLILTYISLSGFSQKLFCAGKKHERSLATMTMLIVGSCTHQVALSNQIQRLRDSGCDRIYDDAMRRWTLEGRARQSELTRNCDPGSRIRGRLRWRKAIASCNWLKHGWHSRETIAIRKHMADQQKTGSSNLA